MTNPSQQAITGQFTLQKQLPNGNSFTIMGYVYDGESIRSLHQRVDHLHDVADRQRTRAEIPEIEAARDNLIERIRGNKIHYALLLKKRDANVRLTTQEKQQLDVMDVNNGEHEKRLAEAEEKLAEMRARMVLPDAD